jgi:crotonobetainyl-CoA:carnitine CoA-transferase CaiB-like acyl-CoA transferase
VSGPLSHLKVLDFTQLLQGPLATQILADLGADVVKFEKPGGEWMRHWGIMASRTHGEMDSFLAFNRNKRSAAVDLKDPAAVRAVLDLAPEADVVVENFRPGVMDRLGLGYEAFRERNERIVYASSSGFGQTGPYAHRPGQDLLAQASASPSTCSRARSPPSSRSSRSTSTTASRSTARRRTSATSGARRRSASTAPRTVTSRWR